ncbi:MAG: hypothetical protein ACTHK2_11845 [Dokdonella sp.]|uniref:hypothetical protein n=1 Tax=Dokdonella sp. TaxID=2291710 RepID=UPI003F81BF24
MAARAVPARGLAPLRRGGSALVVTQFRRSTPCFAVGDRELVLPAFSAFTVGHPLARSDGGIACIGDGMLPNLR